MDKKTILERCRKEKVRFLRLQFTDILGVNKNVEVPEGQFEKALEGRLRADRGIGHAPQARPRDFRHLPLGGRSRPGRACHL